jgi:hypothetical protein
MSTARYAVRFITLLLAAFALVPGMAHLLEMAHKRQLTMENYGIVQYIYRGWAWLGVIQAGAVLFSGLLFLYERKNKPVAWLVLGAFSCLALTLVIFFSFTYPVNVVTQNWAFLPDDWMQLRDRWEYSHAINAILEAVAYILLLSALLRRR